MRALSATAVIILFLYVGFMHVTRAFSFLEHRERKPQLKRICRSGQRSFLAPQGQSSQIDKSLILSVTPWYQDDLPNILGINPLEAAVIFGALYYYYGPTTLYKYTREAGVFFSTYAPIVRDLVTDIVTEFREYLDEDKEREDLRKAGVDIDNLPRRTTNIIERFQDSLDTFSEMTGSLNGGGDLDGSNTDDEIGDIEVSRANVRSQLEREQEGELVSGNGKKRRKKSRKTKREVIAEDSGLPTGDVEEQVLVQSDAAVQEQFNNTQIQLENNLDVQASAAAEASAVLASMSGSQDTSQVLKPDALIAQQMQVQAALASRQAEADAAASKDRFAAQLDVDDWNAKIMRQGTSIAEAGQRDVASNSYGWPSAGSLEAEGGEFGPLLSDKLVESQFPIDPEWQTISEGTPFVTDVPQDLSASDSFDKFSLDVPQGENFAVEVLRELDRDYLSLRERVISLIEEQNSGKGGVEIVRAAKEMTENDEDAAAEKRKYWPPRSIGQGVEKR